MVESSEIQSEKLILDIEKAFSNVEYPGDDEIVYDNTGYHLECNEIKEVLKGKDWRSLSLDMLRYHAEGLFFLTPEGYRFYLPAYLLASIRSYREADMIPTTIVHSLNAPQEQDSEMAPFSSRISNFNQDQKTVIKRFLEFLRTKYTGVTSLERIDTALKRF
ncbi:hypothetical protein IQ276_005190 [Desmonostoc muscorum LEGE 12446]|uniref:Uncharacterized protein n=1 Tax=Desmonostoc muscorum LEGE 12446 TaxID=1828758 RepID=A0A8J6ZVX0_DESMC|nr:DUF6714 family protein [Desmonostoc muscorum]MCF2145864.1 hypothetical protein [Desmonostoc muscorum LEGE 12446]